MDTIENRFNSQISSYKDVALTRKQQTSIQFYEGVIAGLKIALEITPDWVRNMDLDNPNQVPLPEYVYVPYRIGMPPDGKAGCWFTQTLKPESLKHLLQLQMIYNVVFFHHEMCEEYVKEQNRTNRFED
jgi:hypothetical protein